MNQFERIMRYNESIIDKLADAMYDTRHVPYVGCTWCHNEFDPRNEGVVDEENELYFCCSSCKDHFEDRDLE